MTALPADLTDELGRPFRVRLLEPADRDALIAMYIDFEPKRTAQGLPPVGEEAIARWLDRVVPQGIHLVAETDGEIIGHALLMPMGDVCAEFAIFLHQHHRNRGIGTAMNRLALETAREHGCARVWLSVQPSNRAAIRSYEKAGFRFIPTADLWASEIEMEAVLV